MNDYHDIIKDSSPLRGVELFANADARFDFVDPSGDALKLSEQPLEGCQFPVEEVLVLGQQLLRLDRKSRCFGFSKGDSIVWNG